MPAPSDILRDGVTFHLRSIDRLYLDLYQPRLQTPGQVRAFLCGVRDQPLPSPALFGQMTRDFVARVERYAAEHQVPVVAFPRGADKEDIADGYFARAPVREGVILIGTAQERASSWWGPVRRGEAGLECAYAKRTVAVKHYYFYLRDREWGRAFLKFCSYAPCGGRLSTRMATAGSGASSSLAASPSPRWTTACSRSPIPRPPSASPTGSAHATSRASCGAGCRPCRCRSRGPTGPPATATGPR